MKLIIEMPRSALNLVLLVSTWSAFGINMIYFLMGLQNIPNELYECAALDGAPGSFSLSLFRSWRR
jgi:ABC-type sugar transport system permease subunit